MDQAELERHGYRVRRYGPGWTLLDADGAPLLIGDHGSVAPRQVDAVAEGLRRIALDQPRSDAGPGGSDRDTPSGYAIDCDACGLSSDAFIQDADEAGQLAGTHDDIHHRGRPTARPVPVSDDTEQPPAMAATRCDTGAHEGAAYWTAGSAAPEVTPDSDAEFLAGCERYAATLRGVAEGLHEWVNTLHDLALPTAVLDPLHTTAVAIDAAATDLTNAAATFTDEFATARDVAGRGLTITGE